MKEQAHEFHYERTAGERGEPKETSQAEDRMLDFLKVERDDETTYQFHYERTAGERGKPKETSQAEDRMLDFLKASEKDAVDMAESLGDNAITDVDN